MGLRADAAADLAAILDDDDAGEAALWRPAGLGGSDCRVTVGGSPGDLGLASGLGLDALAAVAGRARLAAIAGLLEGTARDPAPGDVLALVEAASAAPGEWLVVAATLDLYGAVRLALVPRTTARVGSVSGATAVVVPSLDHLVEGPAGEAQEREADALIGRAVAPGDVVVVSAGAAAGTWAVVAVAGRDGGLYRCRLRWRTRARSNDGAVRQVPR